ncbi:MAG: MBL fold metallo-hydrolase [Micromonosporaceae bacterium]|nr:MBL fold metallo-hydrolase [Micromonosporaceae bacterium]
MTGFEEVADRVFVLRYPVLDVNTTLVLGEQVALVVDTLSTDAQARELAEQARRVTSLPYTLVNTHHHYDHCFGNAVLAEGGRPIWGHRAAIAELADRGEYWRRAWCADWQQEDPEVAAQLAAVRIVPPDHPVDEHSTVDLGGRSVLLRHFGRGHTEGDLVVLVPDAGVVLAGDLVEESGPPGFGDAYPLEWPETLAALLHLVPEDGVVVPGHGAAVGRSFVEAQHGQLSELDWLIRAGEQDGADAAKVAARSPFGLDASLVAVRRGYAELSGRA